MAGGGARPRALRWAGSSDARGRGPLSNPSPDPDPVPKPKPNPYPDPNPNPYPDPNPNPHPNPSPHPNPNQVEDFSRTSRTGDPGARGGEEAGGEEAGGGEAGAAVPAAKRSEPPLLQLLLQAATLTLTLSLTLTLALTITLTLTRTRTRTLTLTRSMAQDFGPTSCTGLYEDGDVDVEICWPREGDGRCSFHRRLAARQTHLITEEGARHVDGT